MSEEEDSSEVKAYTAHSEVFIFTFTQLFVINGDHKSINNKWGPFESIKGNRIEHEKNLSIDMYRKDIFLKPE